MTRYGVYLEIARNGQCYAHVPDLPGCFVRAASRDEALGQLPEVIRAYGAWLGRHGEPAPPDEDPLEIQVNGECSGCGPFDPGDTAELLPADREPVTPEQMEGHLRLLDHSRGDLLALVRDLPDTVLDWQADADALSVRRLLRHVGNAEEWYVSRLVAPETLPPEWEHDEELPILEFLEMERRTAFLRLRQLGEHERSVVCYPTQWTNHPEEAWTARKALRRFLEHEREHTAQARELLGAWRAHLLAHLAVERASLLERLLGLDERTLTTSPVFDDWTAKDLLAHIAGWDELFATRIELILAGRAGEIVSVEADPHNAVLYAERRDWPLAQALEACVEARVSFLAALARLTDEELHRRRHFAWGEGSIRNWTEWRARHDAAHSAPLEVWAKGARGKTGCAEMLLAALNAAREEFVAAAALVPQREAASRPVCGEWTLKDVVGHLADWEWLGVQGLRQMAAGQRLQVDFDGDVEAWNRAHLPTHDQESWESIWAGLCAARSALLQVLTDTGQSDLGRPSSHPFEAESTPYRWVWSFLSHDREHARDLRRSEETT
jgi:predicted RNase H-like HicB family nuclease/uncharacterized damage-inducible protein DinB